MLLKIDERQLGAILAGLRLLQDHAYDGYDNPAILDVFTDGRTVEPMNADEIAALCEGVNGGDLAVDEGDVRTIERQWRDRCAVQNYRGDQRLDLAVEFFTGAMAARHAAGMERWCPPKWYLRLIRGEVIGDDADD